MVLLATAAEQGAAGELPWRRKTSAREHPRAQQERESNCITGPRTSILTWVDAVRFPRLRLVTVHTMGEQTAKKRCHGPRQCCRLTVTLRARVQHG